MHQGPEHLHEHLRIGRYSEDPRESPHLADQRVVFCLIGFERLSAAVGTPDYRPLLHKLWYSFLAEAELSADFVHQGWSPSHGLMPIVIGWVWRHGTEQIGTVTEQELFQLIELLRSPNSNVIYFKIIEQTTTDQFGKNHDRRKFLFRNGEYSVEVLPSDNSL